MATDGPYLEVLRLVRQHLPGCRGAPPPFIPRVVRGRVGSWLLGSGRSPRAWGAALVQEGLCLVSREALVLGVLLSSCVWEERVLVSPGPCAPALGTQPGKGGSTGHGTNTHHPPQPLSFPLDEPGWMRKEKRSFQQLHVEAVSPVSQQDGERMAPRPLSSRVNPSATETAAVRWLRVTGWDQNSPGCVSPVGASHFFPEYLVSTVLSLSRDQVSARFCAPPGTWAGTAPGREEGVGEGSQPSSPLPPNPALPATRVPHEAQEQMPRLWGLSPSPPSSRTRNCTA